ncbi:MAG: hypothetical protein IJE23_03610 [Tyzzerella sp.]|nr:hypothetical protein [Tyzzerella sp.]
MITDKAAAEIEEFEAIYRLHADNLYKYCLYYLEDEEKAKDITQQAFFNFYKYFQTVSSDMVLKYLVYEAKKLVVKQSTSSTIREELKEWTKIGKNLFQRKWRKVWMKSWMK